MMKQEVEKRLGFTISDEDFKEAERYARHKLNWQNQHFGTNYGEDYLVLLIADTYHENEFSKYTWRLCLEKMKKEGAVLC